MSKVNIGIDIDVEKLLESKAIVQANSGGGKSYAVRKLVEAIGNKVQQIVLDPEGEFVTLREKFDFALVAKDGDIPLNLKYAEMLAHKLLETNLSCIIDLYELKHYERILFVKRFLEALINAPKELWHDAFIYVDEAHIFCPEATKNESTSAVIELCSRGRKRGFAAILATQRISKLHKDAAAECQNKMIGRTSLDIDRNRSGDELGMTKKTDNLALRDLQPGEFFAYGPAISNTVSKFKVLPVITTHLKAGKKMNSAPPTPAAIKKILSKLANIPEEAERELNNMADMRKEITRLRGELTKAIKPVPASVDPIELQKWKTETAALKQQLQLAQTKEAMAIKHIENIYKITTGFGDQLWKLNEAFTREISKTGTILQISETKFPKNDINVPKNVTTVQEIDTKVTEHASSVGNYNSAITGGAMRMLKAAAMYYPGPITKIRMAAISRLSHSSGSFGTYISTLKSKGYLVQNGKDYTATEQGFAAAGNIEALPTNPDQLVEMWCDIIGSGSGAARILRKLKEVYPRFLSKADLGAAVEMSHTSGSFGTYISKLKGNGLIVSEGQSFKASSELFD